MYRRYLTIGIVGVSLIAGKSPALAQRGVGDAWGVARQAALQPDKKPQVVTLAGTLEAITVAPCERTTGRAQTGVHLLLLTAEGEQLNVHVGPAADVDNFMNKLSLGDEITVRAFRTEKMPADDYVATSLVSDDVTVDLRDASLRPYWAGSGQGRGGGLNRGNCPWGGGGYGRGRGMGPCRLYDSDAAQATTPAADGRGGRGRQMGFAAGGGRGPGYGAGGQGRGYGGRGPGYGGGRGPGYAAGRASW